MKERERERERDCGMHRCLLSLDNNRVGNRGPHDPLVCFNEINLSKQVRKSIGANNFVGRANTDTDITGRTLFFPVVLL